MEINRDNKLLEIRDVINTENARINYLSGLIRIAESDNNRSPEEEGYIYNIAEIIGASYSEVLRATKSFEDGDLKTIHFETRREKILFLMHALYMCWLDDDYSDAEREEIITIGQEVGIEQTDIARIESWIKQGIEWMSIGADLLKLEQ